MLYIVLLLYKDTRIYVYIRILSMCAHVSTCFGLYALISYALYASCAQVCAVCRSRQDTSHSKALGCVRDLATKCPYNA